MKSEFLHFSEHTLQEVALVIMALVYTTRIIWFLRFKAGGDRQAPTGLAGTTPGKGVLYSWANVAMPWSMESTRRQLFLYVQFVVFHLGVTAAIGLSFIIPYWPALLESTVLVRLLQVVIGAAFVVSLIRIVRRVGSKYMRAISSPDDYFSLILLTVWFFFAFLAVPNDVSGGEGRLLTFFILTAFFLIYVPFSKISHYLYYPFTRYYLGKTMGYRGVYPLERGRPAG
jgi:nitrate reductase gamma subunit